MFNIYKNRMNDFGVSNTTTDVTNVGPLSQQLSVPGPSILTIDGSAPTQVPITFADLKQASLSGVIVRPFPSGGSTSDFTLNKKPGAADGSVANALISEFNLRSEASSVILKFHNPAVLGGTVRLTSDDVTLSIQTNPINLFTAGNSPGETHVLMTINVTVPTILAFQRHTTPYVIP
jgi:hypothetical protein